MKAHHRAWLDAHPERSLDWLKRMLSEGFDVHHVDGDHSNNHPANLALIEAIDHMRLHGLFGLVRSDIREVARKGGKARMAQMSPKERSAHGKMMAMTRIKRDRKLKAARLAAAEMQSLSSTA